MVPSECVARKASDDCSSQHGTCGTMSHTFLLVRHNVPGAIATLEQGSLHEKHLNPLFWWEKQHVSNGCKMNFF